MERLLQGRQVALLLQSNGAGVFVEAHCGTGAEHLLEERAGGQVAVAGGQVEREQAVQVVGRDGHGEVEIGLDHHGGGQAVEVEEGELLGDGLLDQPAAGVAAQDVRQGAVKVVGEEQGGSAAGVAQDSDLAQFAVVAAERHAGVVRFDQARALLERDADLLAGRGVEGAGPLDEALAAAAHGDEEHAVPVEPGEVGVGGEAAVEGEAAHRGAVAAEEVEGFEDGTVGGFPVGAGVGPQDQTGVGIPGEGDREADERASAVAGPVLLQGGVVPPVGDRGEIQVRGIGCQPAFAPDTGEGGQQALVHGADHAIGIGGEPSGLGQDVEAGEEARTAIARSTP